MEMKTFSLNCWTVPLLSKDIAIRVDAIGDYLSQADYDIVFLQEVWSLESYQVIKNKCKHSLPHSRCFFSGRVGTSGLCVFSRHRIIDTFFHPYLLNGYWHAVLHGDNHVRKGVAYLRIKFGSISINCFLTHLHAEYDRKKDVYFAHRLAQAYELLKFTDLLCPVNESSTPGLSIIAGDLNLEPQDLGICHILAGGFFDSWREYKAHDLGATCDLPGNRYTPNESKLLWPNGRRIDYTFYRPDKLECSVQKSEVLAMKVPVCGLPFSDHEAVVTTFHVDSSSTNAPSTPIPMRLSKSVLPPGCEHLQEVLRVFESSARQCAKDCGWWLIFIACFALVGVMFLISFPAVSFIGVPLYTVAIVGMICHYFLVKREEYIHLLELTNQVEVDLASRNLSDNSTNC